MRRERSVWPPRPVGPAGSGRGEGGSATVYALVAVGLLILAAVVVAAVAGLLVGHRQAASAADLAALAGAAAAQRGEPACGAARHIAGENHASLVDCSERDQTVDVEVAVRMPALFGARALRDRARAGPVSAAAFSDDGPP